MGVNTSDQTTVAPQMSMTLTLKPENRNILMDIAGHNSVEFNHRQEGAAYTDPRDVLDGIRKVALPSYYSLLIIKKLLQDGTVVTRDLAGELASTDHLIKEVFIQACSRLQQHCEIGKAETQINSIEAAKRSTRLNNPRPSAIIDEIRNLLETTSRN